MDLWNANAFTRRTFLTRGLVLASAATTIPSFLSRSALAMSPAAGLSSLAGVPEDRILVVVQLAGGNDGLNSVIPYRDAAYYRSRPGIAIAKDRVLTLGRAGEAADVGLHPQLTGFKSLYDDGLMSLVQGVGYPNPNRSHFKSMDILHTADTSATGNGWLGRYFDNECCGNPKADAGAKGAATGGMPASKTPTPEPLAGISIGREAPLAMQGQFSKPVGFESAELFKWLGGDIDPELKKRYAEITEAYGERQGMLGAAAISGDERIDPDSNAAFLMRTSLDAQVSSDLIRKAVAKRAAVSYPQTELGRQLAMVGSMIRAGLKTRVYYVSLGGFDTHAGQGGEQGRHAQLMQQLGGAVKAFYDDLKETRNAERVLTLSFSEFGRRVAQNASGGTDHGAAAPMFLFGPMVRAGVVGNHPSLTDLDQGDLKHGIDFRSVYAAILEDWLKADSRKVLERAYKPVRVIRA